MKGDMICDKIRSMYSDCHSCLYGHDGRDRCCVFQKEQQRQSQQNQQAQQKRNDINRQQNQQTQQQQPMPQKPKVETSVSEKDAAKIKLGVYASCVIDGKKYRGTVSDIIDYTDISDQDTDENSTDKPKRDRITIRIALPEENDNSAIHPGQRAEIKLTK